MSRRDRGLRGEELSRSFLKKKGYRIRETNFRCPYGEIDIVAEKDGILVFVEVRTKSSPAFGPPEESLTRGKREHLIASAFHYLQTRKDLPQEWRIDLVAVELGPGGEVTRLELVENALS